MWSSLQIASLFKLKYYYYFLLIIFLSAIFTQWHFNSLGKKGGWLIDYINEISNEHAKSHLPGFVESPWLESGQPLIRVPGCAGFSPGCFWGSRSVGAPNISGTLQGLSTQVIPCFFYYHWMCWHCSVSEAQMYHTIPYLLFSSQKGETVSRETGLFHSYFHTFPSIFIDF